MKNICVYGASSDALAKTYFDETFQLGALIAQKGYGLVYGGGATGVMGSLAKGAHSKDGRVIGVVPSFMDIEGLSYGKCDEKILTDTMRKRKQIMEDLADYFVCAPGGVGTFEEFFEILTLKQLRQHEKAIVLFNANHYYDDLLTVMDTCINQMFAKKETLDLYTVANTPQEVMEQIETYEFIKTGTHWLTYIGAEE